MGRLALILPLACAVAFSVEAIPYSKVAEGYQYGEGFASKTSSSSLSSSYSQAGHGKIVQNGMQNGQAFASSKTSAYSSNGGSHSSSYSSSSVGGSLPAGIASSSSQAVYGVPGVSFGAYDANSQDGANFDQAGKNAGSQFWWMKSSSSPFLRADSKVGCSQNGCSGAFSNPFLSGSSGISSFGSSSSAGSSNAIHASSDYSKNPFLNGVSAGSSSKAGYANNANSLVSGSSYSGSSYSGSSGNSYSGNAGSSYSGNSGASNFVSGSKYSGSSAGNGLVAGNSYSGSSTGNGLVAGNSYTGNSGANNLVTGSNENSGFKQVTLSSPQVSQVDQVSQTGQGGQFAHQASQGGKFAQSSQGGQFAQSSQGGQFAQNSQGGKFAQNSQGGQFAQSAQGGQFAQASLGGQFGQSNQYDQQQQQQGGFVSSSFDQSESQNDDDEESFTVTCTGEGRFCVPYYLCSAKGFLVNDQITQVKSGPQVCDLNSEVCCSKRPADQSSAGTSTGGLFGNANIAQQGSDFATGEISNGFTGSLQNHAENNGYLPPDNSQPSANVPAILDPPKTDEISEPDFIVPVAVGTTPPPSTPQSGCAAALICTVEIYCDIAGVITTEPKQYSPEQRLRGVPLISCKNPETGIIGKCCRDPNYVDPWPMGNLPANFSGGFDEKGFPKFLNLGSTQVSKTQPPNRGTVKGPTKTAPRPIPSLRPEQSFFDGAVNYPAPVQLPEAPYPQSHYDTSSSNQIIAPHVPGRQCGLRNKVTRPNGLTDADVAFGEIPWQAMVLSTADRKLLCSGAIVAPNAIVTAASCVERLQPGQVAIKTGEWKLGYELKNEEPLPFEIINVASIAPYPAFTSGNPANDISILFLEHDIKLDQHVDVLCLPEGQPKPPAPGAKCIATGWGKTVLQVNIAGSLMHGIDVDVLDNVECLQRIAGAESQIPLDDSLVCAKPQKQNNNMCQVDYGGPLACDRGDGYYVLSGIYNQDTGCVPTNQVATFATIPSPWIKEMMANPPRYVGNEYLAPASSGSKPTFVHNHGPNEPCNCQEHELLPAGTSQYLPPV